MTAARERLMQCISREQLDQQSKDPWSASIAPLFNDTEFKSHANTVLAGGITLDDISFIDPADRPYFRDGGVLKRKFGEFKSLNGTYVARYEASRQGDPDAFAYFADGKSHIMYAYCYLQVNPILQPLATRVLDSDVQREEGVGDGISPYGFGGREVLHYPEKTRRANSRDINIVGVGGLISALNGNAEEPDGDSRQSERRKRSFEKMDAASRATRSTLQALNEAKQMQLQANTEEEKIILKGIIQKLLSQLAQAEAAM